MRGSDVMTKGERIVAEVLGTDKPKSEPIMTASHPFLRKVIPVCQEPQILDRLGNGIVRGTW